MSSKLVYNISKIARNSLQLDLIKAMLEQIQETKKEIKKYEEMIFIPFFNLEQIEKYEKFMNLSLEKDWSLEDRRDRIIYTLLSKSIFSIENLKTQAMIFTNGEIEVVENFEDYSFEIMFTSIIGAVPNIKNFIQFVEINKPAHLNYKIVFLYRVHKKLKPYTHAELRQYKHGEIYSKNDILGGVNNG